MADTEDRMNRRSFFRFLGVAPVAAVGAAALPAIAAPRGITAAEAIKRLNLRTGHTLIRKSELIPLRAITFDNVWEMKEHTARTIAATARWEAQLSELQKQIPRSDEDDREISKIQEENNVAAD